MTLDKLSQELAEFNHAGDGLRASGLNPARRCYNPTMQSDLTEAAKKLSIPERINLVEEIWDTIAEENCIRVI